MGKKKTIFIVLLVFSLLIGMNQNLFAQVNEQDSLALVALYDSTDGANWTDNSNWLSGPVSTWFGVTVTDNRVSELILRQNNLVGTIPPEIGDLTELTMLDFWKDLLTGPLPPEIGNLTKLETLNLTSNQLDGAIPPEFGNLSNLVNVFAGRNQFRDSIPSEIGKLTNLNQLHLYVNQLSGSIPAEIGNLTSLNTMDLSSNQLTGDIPNTIRNLTNLNYLNLSSNSLIGPIPSWIGEMTSLTDLYLQRCDFSGSIPPDIANLTNLAYLGLCCNNLSDSIPSEIVNLTNLVKLQLYANELTGPIPQGIGNLINLTDLNLNNNQLSGTIPPEIGNLVNLESLTLEFNELKGEIPAVIGNLTNLETLFLEGNQFSGAIPAELTNLTKLTELWLYMNQLDDLPDLSPITTLKDLQIHGNRFTFEDIEPNISISSFVYSPQDSVGIEKDTVIIKGAKLELSVSVDGTVNQYQWMKNGVEIQGADSSSYTIHSADSSDAGFYHCRITNSIATELTLYSRPIHVTIGGITGVAEPAACKPEAFALYQNYPNPFNPSTTIRFSIPEDQKVRLSVYNLLGQLIRTLVDEEMEAGRHSIVFNAAGLSSGVYFYRMQAESFVSTKRFILLK